MTTDLAQYLILEQLCQCVPQKAIEIISENKFVVHTDNGDFAFIYKNGELKSYEDDEEDNYEF